MALAEPNSQEPKLNDLFLQLEALTKQVNHLLSRNAVLEKQLSEHAQQAADKPSWQSTNPVISTAPTSISERNDDECLAPNIESWKKLKEMRGRNVDAEKLERDFTTLGRTGDLRCPFSERVARRSSLRPSTISKKASPSLCAKGSCIQDPIAAEFHADIVGSPPASIENLTARCPIRFMDDHSPQEVAKYFENHKHEIPRSHEVCIKKYQANEESIRQLDAKYGDLVHMLQGIGVKHQPMLPTDDVVVDQKSAERVEKWAEECVQDPPPEDVDLQSEQRASHFERPLQEVRLGESPSRPWGIQVPLDKESPQSANGSAASNAAQSIAAAVESTPEADSGESVKKCPFSKLVLEPTVSHLLAETNNRKEASPQDVRIEHAESIAKPQSRPSIVFNGPVFFNYPASDIEAILSSLPKSS